MSLPRELREALAAHDVHRDIRAVLESAAAEHAVAGGVAPDGSVVVRSAAGGASAVTVHPDQLYLAIAPDLVRQVRDDIGWAVRRGTGATYHVTIHAEDLLGPASQLLAVSLLQQAIERAALVEPPPPPRVRTARPAPTRTTTDAARPAARPAGTRAATARAAASEPPQASLCPICFQEMLGGHCANCE